MLDRLACCTLFVCFLGCGAPGEEAPVFEGAPALSNTNRAPLVTRSVGTARTLDVGSWNVEWFGAPSQGPEDDALQEEGAAEIIRNAKLDLWGLQEIVDAEGFRRLARDTGYAGVLASDHEVEGGAGAYSPGEQKLALLYDPAVLRLRDARVILSEESTAFAGRPPLEARFEYEGQNGKWPLTVVVVHLKAGRERSSYERRVRSAAALKSYLDDEAPNSAIFVVGDWNDDLDVSDVRSLPSPFESIVRDEANYFFPTYALTTSRRNTLVSSTLTVDHHMASRAAARWYVQGSAQVLRADRWLDDYSDTISDHYPVITQYDP